MKNKPKRVVFREQKPANMAGQQQHTEDEFEEYDEFEGDEYELEEEGEEELLDEEEEIDADEPIGGDLLGESSDLR